VRKEAKEYGASAGESIEGELKSGEKLALIEDVVTTGTQAVAAAGRLEEAGAEVAKIVAVLDRREAETESLEDMLDRFPFVALLRMEELRVAKED
jgi:orotate phosphoribosyltransferase